MPHYTTAESGANQDPWRSSAKNGPACGMDNRISLCTEKKNTDIPECWIRCRLGIAWLLVCQDTRISWPLVVGPNIFGVDG